MAFKLVKCGGQSVPIITKYLMNDNEGCTLGEALTLDGATGRLTKCAATTTPEFIAEKTVAAAATSTVLVPVHRVDEMFTYEVPSTGQIAATARGSKYTLHTDGLRITATTTNGVFEVHDTDGATPSLVRGHFNV